MEIGGIGRGYSVNPAAKDQTSSDTGVTQDQETSPAFEEYDRLVHGLSKLAEATDKADEEAKARAKQKLKDAQEQLKFLQRWGMDPEVIARQAAMLGVVVAAAAREFAEALTGGTGVASMPTATANAASAETQPDVSDNDASDTAGEEQATSQAEQAYRDVMDDGKPARTSSLSPDDIRTATEFSTIAKQIKALLEEAARDLREKSNATISPSTQNLDAAVAAMTGAVAAAPSVAITI